ncbi:methyltransferase domain-containing protein [Paenibacillus sp. P96]|uniref:Methyltransferase domain-containing protein n=1 Tax=Paenibacillus zeirhizosphaerae TaxID=2987519 RepID=A0ABT9FTX4_9BACL|nr:methyltransferase domain-containing protein [Paenibacillus sp. P96]MDP4098193.1 methyltransferase domain-containing protein [Paenibacillus sp. P96]
MITLANFQQQLHEYLEKFEFMAEKYDQTARHSLELELLIDDYSRFITNVDNEEAWRQLERQNPWQLDAVAAELRAKSALCVAIMEKYRALKLLHGEREIAHYFRNIEACIEKEFGSFHITSDAKVLLVGSGSFPMTPLLIAKRTGAEVIGIDIDEEAISLGLRVVEKLGAGLNIRLEQTSAEDLDVLKDITHIIFSSTVAAKYDILDQLYILTSDQVVVAMRYGNQLKSLFNYPMKECDRRKWKLVDHILRPDDVFDIALYTKA